MNTVKIKNRETGEVKSGNWKGLRKALGVNRNYKASSCVKVFDSLGWDVIAGAPATPAPMPKPQGVSNPAVSVVESIASGVNARCTVVAKETDVESEIVSEILESDTSSLEHSDDVFSIPQLDPDYVERHYDNQLARILDNLASKEYPFLYGDAAGGKTTMVKQYCAKRRIPYTRVALDETMSIQFLLGRLTIDNGTVVYREGLLVKAMQRGGVLFLDEANGITPNKNFLMHPLLDSGEVFIPEADKTFVKHPECRIVLAGNYQSGKYTGVQKMNGAFQTRLCPIEIEALDVSEIKLNYIQRDERAKLIDFYNDARSMLESQKSKALVTLRHYIRYDRLRSVGFDEREAVVIAFINAVKYTDDKLAGDLLMSAKSRFGF